MKLKGGRDVAFGTSKGVVCSFFVFLEHILYLYLGMNKLFILATYPNKVSGPSKS